ncbi:MAG: hypothetical protein ACTSVV_16260, partial [Promethearchaeota archaeon]
MFFEEQNEDLKDKTGKKRKHGVTENIYGFEFKEPNILKIRGLNLFELLKNSNKKLYQISKDGIELGNLYLKEPNSNNWKIKLLELILKYDIRFRLILILQNKLDYKLFNLIRVTEKKGIYNIEGNKKAFIEINKNKIYLFKEDPEHIKFVISKITAFLINENNFKEKKFLEYVYIKTKEDIQINKKFYEDFTRIKKLFFEYILSLMSKNSQRFLEIKKIIEKNEIKSTDEKRFLENIKNSNIKNKNKIIEILMLIISKEKIKYYFNNLLNKYSNLIIGESIKKELFKFLNNEKKDAKSLNFFIRGSKNFEPNITINHSAFAMEFQLMFDLKLVEIDKGNDAIIKYDVGRFLQFFPENIIHELFEIPKNYSITSEYSETNKLNKNFIT